jgi:hypothetical protein
VSDVERDRLIIAEISGVTARHVPLSARYPHGEAAAIADVQAVARGRADLLARFAGTYLGLSAVQLVDQRAAQMVAQASLAARAGAAMDAVGEWISVGVERGETIQAARRPVSDARRGGAAARTGTGQVWAAAPGTPGRTAGSAQSGTRRPARPTRDGTAGT